MFSILDPVMTIIGPMPKSTFLIFLMRCLTQQTSVVQFGRIQIFALMKPEDYIVSKLSVKKVL